MAAKDIILADAIEVAIRSEKKIIQMRRVIIAETIALIALIIALII